MNQRAKEEFIIVEYSDSQNNRWIIAAIQQFVLPLLLKNKTHTQVNYDGY